MDRSRIGILHDGRVHGCSGAGVYADQEHTPSLAGRALDWGGEASLEGRIRPGKRLLSI